MATAAHPPVDPIALREMYSAGVTLSIVYSQEVSGTEEKVGGVGVTCSGLRKHLQKNLPIVGVRSGATEGVRPQTLPALAGQWRRVRGEMNREKLGDEGRCVIKEGGVVNPICDWAITG